MARGLKDNGTLCQRHLFLPFLPAQEDMGQLRGIDSNTASDIAVNARSSDHKDEPTRHSSP